MAIRAFDLTIQWAAGTPESRGGPLADVVLRPAPGAAPGARAAGQRGAHGRRPFVARAAVSMCHEPTGIVASGVLTAGHYRSSDLARLQQELLAAVYARLAEKVAAAARPRRRTGRGPG